MLDSTFHHTPILSCRDLSLSYGKELAFDRVSFDIVPNRITSIIGPSGAGKSTLLFCLNRLIEDDPSTTQHGEIKFYGQSTKEFSTNLIRKKIGLIFQKPNPFPLSIRKNIEIPLTEHFDLGKQELNLEIERALTQVGLWEEVKNKLDSSALKLSGGQQQRLCIARTMILKPEILLMDEPCSALDPLATQTIENLIMRLKKECTILIVTHNLAQAKRLSDDSLFFWFRDGAGYLEETGATHTMMQAPKSSITQKYIAGVLG